MVAKQTNKQTNKDTRQVPSVHTRTLEQVPCEATCKVRHQQLAGRSMFEVRAVLSHCLPLWLAGSCDKVCHDNHAHCMCIRGRDSSAVLFSYLMEIEFSFDISSKLKKFFVGINGKGIPD